MPPRILMLGTYDVRSYTRGRVLLKGLQRNGVHVSLHTPHGAFASLSLLARLLRGGFDVVLATGKPALFWAWLLKPLHGKPVVFDVFISDYDTLVLDRKLVRKDSLRAKMLWWADRLSCKMADIAFLDTDAQGVFFEKVFGVPAKRLRRVFVGADDDVHKPSRAPTGKPFRVVWFGSYIPLQGVENIIDAAALLRRHNDIVFELYGKGQTLEVMRARATVLKLKNVVFNTELNAFNGLPERIAAADVILGIFGTSDKARNVIPHKAFEAMACRKPLITSDTPGHREALVDGVNALLVKPGDAKALADAVLVLRRDREFATLLAKNANEMFNDRFAPQHIGRDVLELIEDARGMRGVHA